MDAAELKSIWVDAVRRLLNSDTYRVSNSFENIFHSVAEELTANPSIEPIRFVEAQIKYMINEGRLSKLFPNVLSGDGAMNRYLESPSPRLERQMVMASLKSQADCFEGVCRTMGEEFAFNNPVNDYNPAFLCFMFWSAGKEAPYEKKLNARNEFDCKPMLAEFFPEAFVRFIKS